ncbi:unnamed protein product, partial [Rotaria magnacalcarata]
MLTLEVNHIDHEGVKNLANALESNKTLAVLNLRWNQIGNQGVQYLANALKNNT